MIYKLTFKINRAKKGKEETGREKGNETCYIFSIIWMISVIIGSVDTVHENNQTQKGINFLIKHSISWLIQYEYFPILFISCFSIWNTFYMHDKMDIHKDSLLIIIKLSLIFLKMKRFNGLVTYVVLGQGVLNSIYGV